jgi:hypothetical protein
MQPDHGHVGSQRRLLVLSYSTLASIGLSILLGLATNFYSLKRGNAEIVKLRGDVVEIKRKMADRSDLQALRQSLLKVEKEIREVSDNLHEGR